MKKQIHDSLSRLLSSRLEKHLTSKLDTATCTTIYQDIFECIVDLFQESGIEISNEAMNLVAQMYYDSVKVNGGQELDPNIFTSRAKLEGVPTRELALLATMFNGTPFSPIFVHAVKRRS